jgi:N-acetylglucosamine-6-phosphate deacetylase
VTVWTCGPDGVIEGGAVLIADGVIEAVFGPDDDLPDVETVVDGEGLHLTPGIIDCHSHMATDSGVNEGSQAVTAEVRIGDFIDCDDMTIYRQLAGGVTASNILHGSANPIGGQNQVIKLRWGLDDEAMKMAEAPPGIKFALGENVKRSNSRGDDEGPTRYPSTRMGVEQLIRDTFRAAEDYRLEHQQWRDLRKGLPPRRDLEKEAIVEILEGKRWIHCHSYRQDEILALIRVLDEFDVTIGTFQHILEGYKVAEKMAAHGAMASAFSDWWAYKFEVYDAIPHAGALMHDAGIVVSFNSDDGELATHLNQEAAKAVRYGGVAPEEALKFVTLNPAKQLRIDQYTGSIERGKHADVVLWNGPPLSAYSRVLQTWIDGRLYFGQLDSAAPDELNYREMHAALVQKVLRSGERPRSDSSRDDDPQTLWPRYDENCGSHISAAQDAVWLQDLQEAWEEENN